MVNKDGYIKLGDLDVYKIAIDLSGLAWKIYQKFDWQEKKVIGDQFIESIDSIGANIAEGYGRYHYKDRKKFFYYARGSMFEARHWSLLLCKRGKINLGLFNILLDKLDLTCNDSI